MRTLEDSHASSSETAARLFGCGAQLPCLGSVAALWRAIAGRYGGRRRADGQRCALGTMGGRGWVCGGGAVQWQHDALTAYLREHAGDAGLRHRSVYLTDPEGERKLDDIIAEEYWPQVRDVVRPSRWAVRVDVDGTNPLQAIRTVNGHRHIARELTFLLVDPARWPPQRTRLHNAWDCAGTLRVTAEQEIMFSWRFSLEVPESQVSVASLIPALLRRCDGAGSIQDFGPPYESGDLDAEFERCDCWIARGGQGLIQCARRWRCDAD